jgi:hypothetical protein
MKDSVFKATGLEEEDMVQYLYDFCFMVFSEGDIHEKSSYSGE